MSARLKWSIIYQCIASYKDQLPNVKLPCRQSPAGSPALDGDVMVCVADMN